HSRSTLFPYTTLFRSTSQDTSESLRERRIQYVLISDEKFRSQFRQPFEEWLAQMRGHVVHAIRLQLRAGQGPADWKLVRIECTTDRKSTRLNSSHVSI